MSKLDEYTDRCDDAFFRFVGDVERITRLPWWRRKTPKLRAALAVLSSELEAAYRAATR